MYFKKSPVELNQLYLFGSAPLGSTLREDAMKSDQIKSLIGLMLIFVAAVIIDLIYINANYSAQIFSSRQIHTLFRLRTLFPVLVYLAFLIIWFPAAMQNHTSRLQAWIMLVVGLVILVTITFPPRGTSLLIRDLNIQINEISAAPWKVTMHFGALLVASSLYQLFRSYLSKNHG